MTLYAVKMLKNQIFPIEIPEEKGVCGGDLVLLLTEKGEEVAEIQSLSEEMKQCWGKFDQSSKNNPYKNSEISFIRKLTKEDEETLALLKKEEEEALEKCKELVKKYKLCMNLISCKYTFNKKKISFYYTAPERVDFRELLKELTQVFKRVRIDLRHIGVRDETSMLGGCGLCGRPFCCTKHLRSFDSINIKLARDQGMPITPGKISGSCGRLLCCLNYEYENYLNAAKDLPPVGSGVMTPDGVGKVCALHFLNNKLAVKLEDGKLKEFSKDEIEMIDGEVNIVIDESYKYTEVTDEPVDIKQFEDDKNSSTGQV